jgi:NTP pyrophosphatase (non-canonical NTP hydrolase)
MNPNEYQERAARTECNQLRSVARIIGLNPTQVDHYVSLIDSGVGIAPNLVHMRLNHAILGISNEVGELSRLLIHAVYYGKGNQGSGTISGYAVDPVKLAEELGDCLWHIAQACNAVGLSLEEVMKANIAKLQKRYPEKFTEERAGLEARDRQGELNTVKEIVGKE